MAHPEEAGSGSPTRSSGHLTRSRSGAASFWPPPGTAGSASLHLALSYELSDRGYQLLRNFHHRLRGLLKRCLVFGHRLFVALLFVVGEDAAYPFLVPTSRKFALLHLLPLRRRRRRYAISGLPLTTAVTAAPRGESLLVKRAGITLVAHKNAVPLSGRRTYACEKEPASRRPDPAPC